MKHLTTSQICASLPEEIWNLILAKTEPFTCLIFGRDDIIAEIKGLDDKVWLPRAIEKGRLKLVQAFYRKGSIMLTHADAIELAARNGHLHIIEWFHEIKPRTGDWTTLVMDWAAHRGHLEVVKWLHENRNLEYPQF